MAARPNPQIETGEVSYFYHDFSKEDDFQQFGPNTYNRYYRSFASTNTPGYYDLPPSQRPTNSYELDITVKNYNFPGRYTVIRKSDLARRVFMSDRSSSFFPDRTVTSKLTTAEVQQQAISRLRSLIRGKEMSLGVDLTQMGQTANLLASTARRLAQGVHFLRRGYFSRAASALGGNDLSKAVGDKMSRRYRTMPIDQAVAANFLEMQYGWIPLLNDVKTSWDAIKSQQEVEASRVRTGLTRYWTGNLESDGGYRSDTACTHLIKSTCSASFKFKDEEKARMANLGMDDPFGVAWDILPYSFVVDWFMPVGRYISDLRLGSNVSLQRATVTTLSKKYDDTTYAGGTAYYGTGFATGATYGRKTIYQVSMRRSILVDLLPVFPSPKNPASFLHAAEGMALLCSAFGRTFGRARSTRMDST